MVPCVWGGGGRVRVGVRVGVRVRVRVRGGGQPTMPSVRTSAPTPSAMSVAKPEPASPAASTYSAT